MTTSKPMSHNVSVKPEPEALAQSASTGLICRKPNRDDSLEFYTMEAPYYTADVTLKETSDQEDDAKFKCFLPRALSKGSLNVETRNDWKANDVPAVKNHTAANIAVNEKSEKIHETATSVESLAEKVDNKIQPITENKIVNISSSTSSPSTINLCLNLNIPMNYNTSIATKEDATKDPLEPKVLEDLEEDDSEDDENKVEKEMEDEEMQDQETKEKEIEELEELEWEDEEDETEDVEEDEEEDDDGMISTRFINKPDFPDVPDSKKYNRKLTPVLPVVAKVERVTTSPGNCFNLKLFDNNTMVHIV